MLKIKNLTRTYPTKIPTRALKGVTFEVPDGQFVAIMGRSGSGKSTLLHQLGLIDSPTSGTVYIDNTDVTVLTDAQKSRYRLHYLGYVFQEYALIGEFTAMENVCLPAMAAKRIPSEYQKRAAELLTLVGLGERFDHYPSELSGGEQQRVAIARALINNPKILVADEPTANLDYDSSRTVLELFRKLNKDLKQTIVMVTHEPEDRKFTDRIIWLHDGLIEKEEMVRRK